MTSSHQSLDHVHPLFPQQINALEDIDLSLCIRLFDEDVNGYEGARPSNARTANVLTQVVQIILSCDIYHTLIKNKPCVLTTHPIADACFHYYKVLVFGVNAANKLDHSEVS